MAELVYILANGRIDREIEHFILHELPFCRAMQYLHCHWANSPHYWTVALEGEIKSKAAELVNSLMARIEREQGVE